MSITHVKLSRKYFYTPDENVIAFDIRWSTLNHPVVRKNQADWLWITLSSVILSSVKIFGTYTVFTSGVDVVINRIQAMDFKNVIEDELRLALGAIHEDKLALQDTLSSPRLDLAEDIEVVKVTLAKMRSVADKLESEGRI